MSGFLRQLASRGLGTAPRLRSAPSPQAVALQAIMPADPWRDGASGEINGHAVMAASTPAGGVDTAGGRTRAAQPAMHDPASPARGHATQNAQSTGANGHDAAPTARLQPAPFGAAAISTEAGSPDSDALQGAQHALTPLRRPLELHAVEPDRGMADTRRVGAAAIAPATRPLSAAAARNPLGTPDGPDIAAPSVQPDPAIPGALTARNARRGLGDVASAPRLAAQPPSLPEVHITIDRLEVAPPPSLPRAAPAPRSSALSLRDYLTARRSGLP